MSPGLSFSLIKTVLNIQYTTYTYICTTNIEVTNFGVAENKMHFSKKNCYLNRVTLWIYCIVLKITLSSEKKTGILR